MKNSLSIKLKSKESVGVTESLDFSVDTDQGRNFYLSIDISGYHGSINKEEITLLRDFLNTVIPVCGGPFSSKEPE